MFKLISTKEYKALFKEKIENNRIEENRILQAQNIATIESLEAEVKSLRKLLNQKDEFKREKIRTEVNKAITNLLKKHFEPSPLTDYKLYYPGQIVSQGWIQ